MGIEPESKTQIDGVPVPLYVPETKQIVYFLKNSDIDFDKFNLRGSGQLLQILMNSLAGKEHTIVEINANDFFGTVDHLAKVNYLISRGLKSKIEDNKYDFSGMEKDSSKATYENSEQTILSFELSSSSSSESGEGMWLIFL
jgi:hypothetical protein